MKTNNRLNVRRFLSICCFCLSLFIALLYGGYSWFKQINIEKNVQVINDLKPTVILISFDGFRWDYLNVKDNHTPNLYFLSQKGVKAKALIPSFPTKTFPNHYTIVTGLFPDNHGIIANKMYDPQSGKAFSLGDRDSVQDSYWWGGEPIWVTVEKQGQIAATLFWPGSEAEVAGIQPTYWEKYDRNLAYEKRVQKVLDWLDLPAEKRPTFIALYFESPDSEGHKFGPESPEVKNAVRKVDSILEMLLDALKKRGIFENINLIILSDHGMTSVSSDKTIFLDDYIDLKDVDVIDWSPVLALRPRQYMKEEIYKSLVDAHPNLQIFYKEDIPERLHFKNHRRIAPIIGIADEGWSISSHKYEQFVYRNFLKGNHGYDNSLSSMYGIFIASGPAFKQNLVVEPFENIHVYNLIAEILSLEPAINDGNLSSVRIMLKPSH